MFISVEPGPNSSSDHKISSAEAIAIDFRGVQTEGEEEGGDIHTFGKMLAETVRENIVQRVIRIVTEASEDWGEEGEVVETSKKDEEIRREHSGRYSTAWHMEEGLSPAIFVMETSDQHLIEPQILLATGMNRRPIEYEVEAVRPTIAEILNFGIGSDYTQMILGMLQRPKAALPQKGMSPAEIVEFIEEEGITYDTPWSFPSFCYE